MTDIIQSLAETKVLSTQQIAHLYFPNARSDRYCQSVMRGLALKGLVFGDFPKVAGRRKLPKVWWLTEMGRAAAAQIDGMRGVSIPAVKPGTAQSKTLMHSVTTNEIGILLRRYALARGDSCRWWSERAHRTNTSGQRDSFIISDAYVQIATVVKGEPFIARVLVEYDSGARDLADVHGQALAYRNYRHQISNPPKGEPYYLWSGHYPVTSGPTEGFPTVLFVFDGSRAEARERSFTALVRSPKASTALAGEAGLFLLTTTIDKLRAGGPFSPHVFASPFEPGRTFNLLGFSAEVPAQTA